MHHDDGARILRPFAGRLRILVQESAHRLHCAIEIPRKVVKQAEVVNVLAGQFPRGHQGSILRREFALFAHDFVLDLLVIRHLDLFEGLEFIARIIIGFFEKLPCSFGAGSCDKLGETLTCVGHS